ncbi:MAG: hypothetical protein HQL51_15655 [Magnetococcales bacterium]|nr:hypothetical protein [Magnetococcales bacterium]
MISENGGSAVPGSLSESGGGSDSSTGSGLTGAGDAMETGGAAARDYTSTVTIPPISTPEPSAWEAVGEYVRKAEPYLKAGQGVLGVVGGMQQASALDEAAQQAQAIADEQSAFQLKRASDQAATLSRKRDDDRSTLMAALAGRGVESGIDGGVGTPLVLDRKVTDLAQLSIDQTLEEGRMRAQLTRASGEQRAAQSRNAASASRWAAFGSGLGGLLSLGDIGASKRAKS